MEHFAILMQFLRDRQKFIEDVSKGVRIESKIVGLLISSSVFFAIYGAIIGSFNGWLQMFSSAVKLPALYLLTLVICLPVLYLSDVMSGSYRSFKQYLALLLASMSLIGTMLFGFAPIVLFFRLSIDDYHFFKFLNVAIFAITGIVGVTGFAQSMSFLANQDFHKPKQQSGIIKAWLVLYAFVGSQLGWTLRPFFGDPDQPFQLFRDLESNFYLHILQTITRLLF
ncbi:MAG: actin-binding WH2 domain-containing protein [Coleofasciculaceae cyanobacterium]